MDRKTRQVTIKTLPVTLLTHLIGAPGARRRCSTDAGPWTPVFSHVHFCIKKFSPRRLSHGPPRRTGKKTSCTPPGGNVPSCRCCFRCIPRLSRYTVYTRRERAPWGGGSHYRGCPGIFFLSLLLEANEDREEKEGGRGSGAGTASGRKHLVDREKKRREREGECIRQRKRAGGRKRPLRYPEWHRFFSAVEGAKKCFGRGVKKLKYS